ncbi:MAG: response regulator, partial [Akkermansiaceae bacterium]|nr:response regulator [Akkermansiaceae bacterium]
LEKHAFDLRDALGDTLHALGLRATEKGLELACQVQSDVPDRLLGDLDRFRQVLVNLIGNAVKFTEQGEVVLEVRLQPDRRDDACLHFLIRDTGIGIAPDKQAEIFESFTQAENSTTRTYGGTGLGLAICSQLVKMMDGKIWLESEEGAGSTFHFTARFGLGPDSPGAIPVAPESLHQLRVLVIDDNETSRNILGDMLRNWKMSPSLAAGGAEGLEMLQSRQSGEEAFQLILLDVMMPGMDGIEVVHQVRKEFGDQTPPILVLSSPGQLSSTKDLARYGVHRNVTKPIKQSELLVDAIMQVFELATRNESGSRASRVTPRPSAIPPMKILLAEDGQINQIVATTILQERGHSVTLARNGREALDAFGRGQFDAILMD